MDSAIIEHYFPALTDIQKGQFASMGALYADWNSKINVISRRDIDNIVEHHILHSLAIAKFVQMLPETRVLDFGCGGGFPSIPLAVMFPEVHFHLLDRIGKKLRVAADVAEQLGLQNISIQHGDIAECKEQVQYVVSRAVMPLPDLIRGCRKNISKHGEGPLPNGLITLKGGDLKEEIHSSSLPTELIPIGEYFPTIDYFQDKYVTYTPIG